MHTKLGPLTFFDKAINKSEEREGYHTGDGKIVLRRGKEDTISLKNLLTESFNNRWESTVDFKISVKHWQR